MKKIKYLVYGILIVILSISYRIIENKGIQKADNNKSGKAKVMRLAGIVVSTTNFDNNPFRIY
jgi:hypothetical protein